MPCHHVIDSLFAAYKSHRYTPAQILLQNVRYLFLAAYESHRYTPAQILVQNVRFLFLAAYESHRYTLFHHFSPHVYDIFIGFKMRSVDEDCVF